MRLILCLFFALFIQGIAFAQETVNHFSHEFFEQQKFAHRGGYANGPENTIETVLYNISHGVGAIEIDVEMTQDQKLVIFHDATIERVLQTDEARRVQDMTLEEITRIPLRDESRGKQYVASFEALIDTLTVLIPKNEISDFVGIDYSLSVKENRSAFSLNIPSNDTLFEKDTEDTMNMSIDDKLHRITPLCHWSDILKLF